MIIYEWICDECGVPLKVDSLTLHAYSTGHRYAKYIGKVREEK